MFPKGSIQGVMGLSDGVPGPLRSWGLVGMLSCLAPTSCPSVDAAKYM